MNTRTLLWLVPSFLYAAFFVWYTDFGGPLTTAEIDTYVERLRANGASEARVDAVRRFMEADDGGQFVMANYLDMADTPPRVDGAPADADADDLMALYMEHMYPALFARACHPVFVGDAVFDALDVSGIAGAQSWSRAALMRYRSRRTMMEISTDPAFAGRHEFKLAALDKTIAFPVSPLLNPGDARLLLALVLLVAVLGADLVLFRRGAHRMR